MRYFIFLIALFSLLVSDVYARQTVIAVIDTGFGFTQESLAEKNLCKTGHRDFTPDQKWSKYLDTKDKVPLDMIGHGTNVVGIIDQYAGNANYCIVIIKYFSGAADSSEDQAYFVKSVEHALKLKVDVINVSGGGSSYDPKENRAIKKFLDNGGIFIAAAGNDHVELGTKDNTYYPAMDDPRIIVVGNVDKYGIRHFTSNFGKIVRVWEVGVNMMGFGLIKTGTSQATAVFSGKVINKLRK